MATMMDRTHLPRRGVTAALSATTAAIATMIFVGQVMTSAKLTAAVFYVLVVLFAARFCSARGVVLVGAGCVGLTMLAFFFPGVTEVEGGDPGLKSLVGAAVIGLTTLLVTEHHRAVDALRTSEELWRTMVETAAVGITTLDLDLHHLTANAGFQRMTGYTEAELRSLTVHDITHEGDRLRVQQVIEDVAHEHYSTGLEMRIRRKNGKIIWAVVATSSIRATDGTPTILTQMIVDVTERVQVEAALRASEERWRAMVETAPVGIVTLDFKRRNYLTANASFQRLTGYTADELRQLTTLDITHEDDRAAAKRRIDIGTMGVLQQKRYRRKDGGVIWAEVTAFAVPATHSTPAFLGVVIVDITDRRRAEEAFQLAQADLARRNRVMLLGEMSASLAHELSQPIAAIRNNARAAIRFLDRRLPDLGEGMEALGAVIGNADRAGEIIERIRDHVRKSPPRRDLIDANEAIHEAVSLTQAEMRHHGVRLWSPLGDDLPLISADRVQLQQVMTNLIVNAIEAMGTSDGPRELMITSGRGQANNVFVEVRDTGPGLDPDKYDLLFQSFYTTKTDGIGMGLAISRSIAEAHGGQLLAGPNRPRGALFRLTLPIEETSA